MELVREGKEFCESPISRFLFKCYIRSRKSFIRGASKFSFSDASTLRTTSATAPAFRHRQRDRGRSRPRSATVGAREPAPHMWAMGAHVAAGTRPSSPAASSTSAACFEFGSSEYTSATAKDGKEFCESPISRTAGSRQLLEGEIACLGIYTPRGAKMYSFAANFFALTGAVGNYGGGIARGHRTGGQKIAGGSRDPRLLDTPRG